MATAFLWDGGDDPVELGLFWVGAVLITLFLLEVGMLLVKRGLLALRLFVACALPLLFWMVVAFAASSADDDGIVWGIAGAAVAGVRGRPAGAADPAARHALRRLSGLGGNQTRNPRLGSLEESADRKACTWGHWIASR